MDLTNILVEKFNKFIRDEISAAAGYIVIAQKLKGKDVANVVKELMEHASEEFTHYKELITYAGNHGFLDKLKLVDFDTTVTQYEPKDLIECVKFIQSLEEQARNDYKEMVLLARENDAVELEEFFEDIMGDEIGHFNDLQYIFGNIPTNESILVKSLKEIKQNGKN